MFFILSGDFKIHICVKKEVLGGEIDNIKLNCIPQNISAQKFLFRAGGVDFGEVGFEIRNSGNQLLHLKLNQPPLFPEKGGEKLQFIFKKK